MNLLSKKCDALTQSSRLFFFFLMCMSVPVMINAANVHAANDSDSIFYAVDRGNVAAVQSYLITGDPSVQDTKGRTLLARAAFRNHYDIARILVDAGAFADIPDDQGCTALYRACQKNGDAHLVQLLVPRCRTTDQADCAGMTALHIASQKGCAGSVEALCQADDAPIDNMTNDGKTALWLACYKGHEDVVQCLLKYGANVHQANNSGVSPLLISCVNGNIDLIQHLLNAEADVNQARDNGITPFMLASYFGHKDVVDLLKERGAHLFSQPLAAMENGGATALQQQLQNSSDEIKQHFSTENKQLREKMIEEVKAAMEYQLSDLLMNLHSSYGQHER